MRCAKLNVGTLLALSGACVITGAVNADPVDVKKQPTPSAAAPVKSSGQPTTSNARNKGPEIIYRGIGGAEGTNDLCTAAQSVAIPSTTFGSTLAATIDTDVAFTCGTSITAPGVWYSVIGNGNLLRADTCGFRTYDTKISVYEGDCSNLFCVAGNDDDCGLGSGVEWTSNVGQEYLILVHGFSSGVGDFDLNISEVVPCDITCTPGSTPEGEPICFDFYEDATNGGCNSPGFPSTPIAVNGSPICGTSGTYQGLFDNGTPTNPNDDFVTSFRDTDWFTFTLTEATEVTLTATGEFDSLVGFINGTCPATSFISSATALECQTATTTTILTPGTYFAFVAPSTFAGVACGAEYEATLTGIPFTPTGNDLCVDAIEVAVPSVTSGSTIGASLDPEAFTCGTSTTAPGVWYSVVGTGALLRADTCGFRTYDTKISVYEGDCSNLFCVAGNDDDCGLGSGVEWQSNIGQEYLILVHGFGSAVGDFDLNILEVVPCDITPDPLATLEGEPTCFDFYEDATNGGCNSTPSVFSNIACGETVTGTSGTFVGLFDNGTPTNPNDDFVTNFRDTDWYLFSLDASQQVTIDATAEFDGLIGLINLTAGCPVTSFISSSTFLECSSGSVSALLAPGTYVAFIAPSVFAGYPCGVEYNMTLTCEDPPPPPANDFCENATPIGVGITSGSTSQATIDAAAPFCGTSITAPGVWYSVTGTGNTMSAITCGFRTYDTKISVYCGDCSNLICVGGNDDACGLGSTVTWCSEAGSEYLVLVHGFGSGAGDFDLEIADDGIPCGGGVDCPDGNTCEADLSGSSDPNDPGYGVPDGVVDASDFFYFLDQFVGGNLAVADLSGSSDPNDPGYGVPDGSLDASDFFYFLDRFVEGCP